MVTFQTRINRYRHVFFILFLILVFFFRLMYGLFSEFWEEDELQVYLIGLKFYTTGVLPHYGPDVVYTKPSCRVPYRGCLLVCPSFFCKFQKHHTSFLAFFLFLRSVCWQCISVSEFRRFQDGLPGRGSCFARGL